MSISTEQSRKIYEYISNTFVNNKVQGKTIASYNVPKQYINDKERFIDATFEDFLKGPQDRVGLNRLYKEIHIVYPTVFRQYNTNEFDYEFFIKRG